MIIVKKYSFFFSTVCIFYIADVPWNSRRLWYKLDCTTIKPNDLKTKLSCRTESTCHPALFFISFPTHLNWNWYRILLHTRKVLRKMSSSRGNAISIESSVRSLVVSGKISSALRRKILKLFKQASLQWQLSLLSLADRRLVIYKLYESSPNKP